MGLGGSREFNLPRRPPNFSAWTFSRPRFPTPNGSGPFLENRQRSTKQISTMRQGWHHHLPCVKDHSHPTPHLWKLHLTAYSTLHAGSTSDAVKAGFDSAEAFRNFSNSYRSWSNKSGLKLGISTKKLNSTRLSSKKSAIDIFQFLLKKPIISISPSSAGCSLVVLLQHWIQQVPTAKWITSTSEASQATRKCKAPGLSFV